LAVALPCKLTEVDLAAPRHVAETSVAEMRVVRPDHDPCIATGGREVVLHRIERLGHVPVAEIPRRRAPAIHVAVVALGVAHESGVLLGAEEVVSGGPAVARQALYRLRAQLHERVPRLLLARPGQLRGRGVAVGLAVLAEMI